MGRGSPSSIPFPVFFIGYASFLQLVDLFFIRADTPLFCLSPFICSSCLLAFSTKFPTYASSFTIRALVESKVAMKKYLVKLTLEQRTELFHMISTGKASARELTHARLLLKADQAPMDPAGVMRRSGSRWRSARQRSHACVNAVLKRESRRPSCRLLLNECEAAAWTEPRRRT